MVDQPGEGARVEGEVSSSDQEVAGLIYELVAQAYAAGKERRELHPRAEEIRARLQSLPAALATARAEVDRLTGELAAAVERAERAEDVSGRYGESADRLATRLATVEAERDASDALLSEYDDGKRECSDYDAYLTGRRCGECWACRADAHLATRRRP